MDLFVVALWGHLLAVVVWIGSAFFWTILVFTQKGPPNSDGRASWLERLGRRVHTVGWEALSLLILTGLFTLIPPVRSGEFFRGPYQRTLGLKLVLVTGMVLVQLWQHFGMLPQLTAAKTKRKPWPKLRRQLLITSGLILFLAVGALWMGVQLHHG